MPYYISKVRNKNCYRVTNKHTGKIKAKCTSLKNAKAQIRLLHGIDSGFIMNFNNSKRKTRVRKSPRKTRVCKSPRKTRVCKSPRKTRVRKSPRKTRVRK